MGTGVGEAALAAEAIGVAEAAGAVAGAGGIADAALLGGEFAGGLGLTGGLAEGLGSSALLGGEYAGGLGSLAPAFQTAVGQTASVMPEVSAQVAQAVNPAVVPPAGTPLGTGQTGALATRSLAGQAAPYFADVGGTGASSGLPFPTGGMQVSSPVNFDPTTLATAGQGAGDISALAGNADKAALLSDAGYGPLASPAELGTAAKSPFFNPLTSIYNMYKEQDPLTQGVMKYGGMGLGALQAAKYLNKQPGVAAPPEYKGPLSKFTYSPDTYRPYTYKPYAAGGPVEEMSRENAMGANTGYPQADIRQGAYATPWQTPVSRNVVAGADDANVDMMTGAERMARGGVARFDEGGAASGDAGGDSAAGAGDTGGLASLAYSPSMYSPMMYSPGMMSSSLVDPAEAYAASQPTIDMSRQNFQNFLARYQNYPVTEAPPPQVIYHDLYAAGQGPKATPASYNPYDTGVHSLGAGEAAYDSAAGSPGGGARAGGLMRSMAMGGIANLGGYSDGGRLLKGPGDGMSDNIPANISGKQPARLADGEFVVPADVVSGLGNGSTDAGAKQLYKMLDKVRAARTGTKKQGKQIKPEKYTPA